MPEGVADGVDADGALKVASGGQVRRVVSGEVSVRLAGGN
jgi:biotin-(acetyl-CoA carboxylase) ligase